MQKIKEYSGAMIMVITIILLIASGWFIATVVYGLNQKIDANTQAINQIVNFINANVKK